MQRGGGGNRGNETDFKASREVQGSVCMSEICDRQKGGLRPSPNQARLSSFFSLEGQTEVEETVHVKISVGPNVNIKETTCGSVDLDIDKAD